MVSVEVKRNQIRERVASYRANNSEKVKKNKAEYRLKNLDKEKERVRLANQRKRESGEGWCRKLNCVCGSEFRADRLKEHNATKRHLEHLKNAYNNVYGTNYLNNMYELFSLHPSLT